MITALADAALGLEARLYSTRLIAALAHVALQQWETAAHHFHAAGLILRPFPKPQPGSAMHAPTVVQLDAVSTVLWWWWCCCGCGFAHRFERLTRI